MNELSEEARRAKREYERKWRAENREKVAASNRRYWEKKKKAMEDHAGDARFISAPVQEETALKEAPQFYRLNLKLDGELREYLTDEAWRKRTSITALVNQILCEYRDAHDLSRLFQDFTEKEECKA